MCQSPQDHGLGTLLPDTGELNAEPVEANLGGGGLAGGETDEGEFAACLRLRITLV